MVWATMASAAQVLVVPAETAIVHVDVTLPAGAKFAPRDVVRLVEFDAAGGPIYGQVDLGTTADGRSDTHKLRLLCDIPPSKDATKARHFRLERVTWGTPAAFTYHDKDPTSLTVSEGRGPVFVYNHGTITNERVPQKDGRRSRACYLHPIYGLEGEVLTDDFPKDHYHHHGAFWTWPHVEIDGTQYDLWMNRGIRPEFVAWLGRSVGPVAATLGVENGWFVEKRKVMIERVWMTVHRTSDVDRVLDLDLTWVPVDRPITLRGAEGKSYGGLTVRFAVKDEKKSVITVPSGSGTADLPDTPLPWADMTAKFADSQALSGAAVFVPVDHPDYPPTWLTRHYGPLCVGWPGVKGKTFPAGEPIHLRYRLWMHRGSVTIGQLKEAYAAYTAKVGWENQYPTTK